MAINIEIELFGIGTLRGEFSRVYAPLSTDAIVNKLPIVLRIYKGHNPKSVKNVEKGEIIYNPKTEELLIILENVEMPNKVNKIGRVTNNLELLLNAKNGLNTKINRVK